MSVSGAKSEDALLPLVSAGGGLSIRIHSGMISTGLDCGAGVSCSQSGTFSAVGETAADPSDDEAPFIQSGIESETEPAAGGFIHSGSGPMSALVGFEELNQSGIFPGSTSNGPVFVSGLVHSGSEDGGSASTDEGGGAESQSGIPDINSAGAVEAGAAFRIQSGSVLSVDGAAGSGAGDGGIDGAASQSGSGPEGFTAGAGSATLFCVFIQSGNSPVPVFTAGAAAGSLAGVEGWACQAPPVSRFPWHWLRH